jgi:hypothetical protein
MSSVLLGAVVFGLQVWALLQCIDKGTYTTFAPPKVLYVQAGALLLLLLNVYPSIRNSLNIMELAIQDWDRKKWLDETRRRVEGCRRRPKSDQEKKQPGPSRPQDLLKSVVGFAAMCSQLAVQIMVIYQGAMVIARQTTVQDTILKITSMLFISGFSTAIMAAIEKLAGFEVGNPPPEWLFGKDDDAPRFSWSLTSRWPKPPKPDPKNPKYCGGYCSPAERRRDPKLNNRSVTYKEMCDGHQDKGLSQAQLQGKSSKEYWANLQQVDNCCQSCCAGFCSFTCCGRFLFLFVVLVAFYPTISFIPAETMYAVTQDATCPHTQAFLRANRTSSPWKYDIVMENNYPEEGGYIRLGQPGAGDPDFNKSFDFNRFVEVRTDGINYLKTARQKFLVIHTTFGQHPEIKEYDGLDPPPDALQVEIRKIPYHQPIKSKTMCETYATYIKDSDEVLPGSGERVFISDVNHCPSKHFCQCKFVRFEKYRGIPLLDGDHPISKSFSLHLPFNITVPLAWLALPNQRLFGGSDDWQSNRCGYRTNEMYDDLDDPDEDPETTDWQDLSQAGSCHAPSQAMFLRSIPWRPFGWLDFFGIHVPLTVHPFDNFASPQAKLYLKNGTLNLKNGAERKFDIIRSSNKSGEYFSLSGLPGGEDLTFKELQNNRYLKTVDDEFVVLNSRTGHFERASDLQEPERKKVAIMVEIDAKNPFQWLPSLAWPWEWLFNQEDVFFCKVANTAFKAQNVTKPEGKKKLQNKHGLTYLAKAIDYAVDKVGNNRNVTEIEVRPNISGFEEGDKVMIDGQSLNPEWNIIRKVTSHSIQLKSGLKSNRRKDVPVMMVGHGVEKALTTPAPEEVPYDDFVALKKKVKELEENGNTPVDANGHKLVTQTQLKNSLSSSLKYMGRWIKGQDSKINFRVAALARLLDHEITGGNISDLNTTRMKDIPGLIDEVSRDARQKEIEEKGNSTFDPVFPADKGPSYEKGTGPTEAPTSSTNPAANLGFLPVGEKKDDNVRSNVLMSDNGNEGGSPATAPAPATSPPQVQPNNVASPSATVPPSGGNPVGASNTAALATEDKLSEKYSSIVSRHQPTTFLDKVVNPFVFFVVSAAAALLWVWRSHLQRVRAHEAPDSYLPQHGGFETSRDYDAVGLDHEAMEMDWLGAGESDGRGVLDEYPDARTLRRAFESGTMSL